MIRRTTVFAMLTFASTAYAGVADIVRPQSEEPNRVWTDHTGELTFSGALRGFDPTANHVHLRGANGGDYSCRIRRLSTDDQRYVKNHVSERERKQLPVAFYQDPQPDPNASDEDDTEKGAVAAAIAELVRAAGQPIEVVEKRVKAVTRYRWEVQNVQVVHRYGLFGRRCRVVIEQRQVPIPVQEQVEYAVTSTSQPVSKQTGAVATLSTEVNLLAPKSAGAIAEQVGKVLDGIFPPPSTPNATEFFDMKRENTKFPVNYNSLSPATDGSLYQIAVNVVAGNPRKLVVQVRARDNGGAAISTTRGNARLLQVTTALPK